MPRICIAFEIYMMLLRHPMAIIYNVYCILSNVFNVYCIMYIV